MNRIDVNESFLPRTLTISVFCIRSPSNPSLPDPNSNDYYIMKTIQQIIAEGNSICDLIEAGQHSVAATELFSTLSELKRSMSQADQEGGSINASLDQCMKTKSLPSPFMECDEEFTTSRPEFVFQRPIRIPTNIGSSYNEIIFVSCIVIFNLAIAYHLQGDNESLRKALKLYEVSFNLQREQQFDNNVLFILATINNLGLIHRELHDEQASRMCFEHVLSTLMYLTDCGAASDGQLDGFFRNISGVVSQGRAAPAA